VIMEVGRRETLEIRFLFFLYVLDSPRRCSSTL
jgi:hypothetical protein